ncbi:MAG: hypothetical protein B6D45_03390 [Ignavibacteriales bacterium UTCHB3]|nr:MAG: hypothetical protein B6D45_03390 [Ignavibacteriales bacterium UTCHB3]
MKNKMILKRIFFLFFMLPFVLLGQEKEKIVLHGKVYDSFSREPVVAATISYGDLTSGSITDANGEFRIVLPNEFRISLVISHISYYSYTFTLTAGQKLNTDLVIYLIPKDIHLETVLITGQHTHSKFEGISNIRDLVEGVDFQKNLGLTLAATLKNETGLAIRSMGPAPARPVIRGLGGDRVLFTEDGAVTADLSGTSPDHALTIEPFTINKADIIRGPRVLLYSPVSVGGVVNVARHDIPVETVEGFTGNLGSYYESANGGFLYGGKAEYGTGGLAFQGSFTSRAAGDISTPSGKLNNSYSNIEGYSGGGSYIGEPGFIGYSYRSLNMDYGIPGGFIGAHPNGVRISIYRNVYSGKGSLNINSGLFHNVTLHYARSYYRHKEFEREDLIGAEFRIIDHSFYLTGEHHLLGLNEDGIVGISGRYRDFEVGGFVFTPNSVSKNLSFYFWQPFNYHRLSVEFAARFNGDIITPAITKHSSIGEIRERKYFTWSFSASGIYDLSGNFFLGLNLSRSSRVPTIEELYSEGPHLAAYSYETGNPDLESESGIGIELFSYWKTEEAYALVNLYRYNLTGFIIPRNTGKINYQTFLPVYATTGKNSVIEGIEFEVEYKPAERLSVAAKLSFTHGYFVTGETSANLDNPNAANFSDWFSEGGALPQMPPAKLLLELKYKLQYGTSVEVSAEFAASQERTDLFEQATAGYGIVNCNIFQPVTVGKLTGLITLGMDNIFDVEYRNHLSRVKSIMPEAGRNFRATVRLYI